MHNRIANVLSHDINLRFISAAKPLQEELPFRAGLLVKLQRTLQSKESLSTDVLSLLPEDSKS